MSPYLEADGTDIALQREEARKAEVKAGVAYEGWKKVSKDCYRVTEKTVYTGIMDGYHFWKGLSLALAKKYGISKVGRVIVGGGGALWAKQGVELFGGIYELDKFHLKRALNQTVDKELARGIYGASIRVKWIKVDKLLIWVQQKAFGDQAREISRLRGYLMENAFGLRDYRSEVRDDSLRSSGAIEGNVDKLVANRMKKRGDEVDNKRNPEDDRANKFKRDGQASLLDNSQR